MEKYIGNNYMVMVKGYISGLTMGGTIWHQEFFIDEKSARDYCNRVYQNGATQIELFSRGRDGWYSVKKVCVDDKTARERRANYINGIYAEAEKLGAKIVIK